MTRDVESSSNVAFDCKYHVVFCPKYRRKVLVPPIDARLKEIVHSMCAEMRLKLVEMEVMPDHVHLLLADVDPQFGIHRVVKAIKGRSSRFLRQEFPALRARIPTLWTNSYFVATTGGAPLAVIKRYIERQKDV
jgi:putative transposase